jgi:hypothetical protein
VCKSLDTKAVILNTYIDLGGKAEETYHKPPVSVGVSNKEPHNTV